MAASISDYYLKKRDRGATHTHAVIALAHQRIDVLWALWFPRNRGGFLMPLLG